MLLGKQKQTSFKTLSNVLKMMSPFGSALGLLTASKKIGNKNAKLVDPKVIVPVAIERMNRSKLGKQGSSIGLDQSTFNLSISNASTNKALGAKLHEISNLINALNTADDPLYPMVTSGYWDFTLHGTQNFLAIPFVAVASSDASFTNLENASTDPLTVIDSCINKDHFTALLPELLSTSYQDAGTKRFIAKGKISLTEILKAVALNQARNSFQVESSATAWAGLVFYSEDNGVVSTVDTSLLFHSENRNYSVLQL